MLKNCLNCHTEFKSYQTARKYCSKKCVGEAKRSGAIRYSNSPEFVTKTCPCCGNEFLANLPGHASYKYAPHIRVFCSHKCANMSGKYIGSKSPCLELSPTDAAYIAGFLDGEGCISIYRRKNSYAAKVSFTNTYLPVIEHIGTLIGAGSYKSKSRASSVRHKVAYDMVVNSDFAANLLKQLLPYLIIKKEQARLAIDMQTRLHDLNFRLDKTWQREYFLCNKALNAKGPLAATGEGQ